MNRTTEWNVRTINGINMLKESAGSHHYLKSYEQITEEIFQNLVVHEIYDCEYINIAEW